MRFHQIKKMVIQAVLWVEQNMGGTLDGPAKKEAVINRVRERISELSGFSWFVGWAVSAVLPSVTDRLVDKAVRVLNMITGWNINEIEFTEDAINKLACCLDAPMSDLVSCCAQPELLRIDALYDTCGYSVGIDALPFNGISDTHFSRNLTRREVTCPCGCGFDEVTREIVHTFQALRDYIGRKVFVSSGCRCPQRNASAGGADRSEHMNGAALDIFVVGLPKRQLYAIVREAHALGLLPYLAYCEGVRNSDRAVHIDTGRLRSSIWGPK